MQEWVHLDFLVSASSAGSETFSKRNVLILFLLLQLDTKYHLQIPCDFASTWTRHHLLTFYIPPKISLLFVKKKKRHWEKYLLIVQCLLEFHWFLKISHSPRLMDSNRLRLRRRWRWAGRTCVLPPTTQRQQWSLILFYSRETADVCRDKKVKARKKKAALLDGGHGEVKDDYILLGLPTVIASHFSCTQRQGREWLRTPITLMTARPAMRSS